MVSVITLSFNNYEQLLLTLRSLENAPDIESIVINGGDCQKTSQFLAGFSGSSVTEKDRGIGDAFNKGIFQSKGDAIAFLNSGDFLQQKDYYQTAQDILQRNPQIDFVYSDLWMNKSGSNEKFYATRRGPFFMGKGMPFPHPSLVVRKSVFKKIGGFNTEYSIAMDFEWTLRLLKAGNVGYYLQRTPICMDESGVSVVHESKALEECRRALMLHNEYHGVNFLYFQIRKHKFHLRSLIGKFLGQRTLNGLKSIKFKLREKNFYKS